MDLKVGGFLLSAPTEGHGSTECDAEKKSKKPDAPSPPQHTHLSMDDFLQII